MKPILISTDSYNLINDCDNSASPRFMQRGISNNNRVSPFRNFGYHAGPLMDDSNSNFTLPDIQGPTDSKPAKTSRFDKSNNPLTTTTLY